jgi:hypothetical protein
MAPMNVLKNAPKLWAQAQCPNCKMVFALPRLSAKFGGNVVQALREEVERHVQQNHINLPSCSP